MVLWNSSLGIDTEWGNNKISCMAPSFLSLLFPHVFIQLLPVLIQDISWANSLQTMEQAECGYCQNSS